MVCDTEEGKFERKENEGREKGVKGVNRVVIKRGRRIDDEVKE